MCKALFNLLSSTTRWLFGGAGPAALLGLTGLLFAVARRYNSTSAERGEKYKNV